MLGILISQPYIVPSYIPSTKRAWRYRAYQSYVKSGRELKCQGCGCVQTQYLHIHHKNKDETDNKDSNLVCLCKKCHKKKHFKNMNFKC